MKFFLAFHRSIVDPSFYSEILQLPFGRAFRYLVKLFLLTTTIAAVAHSWVALSRTGLPAEISYLFEGLSIVDQKLRSKQPTPYMPSRMHLARSFELLFSNESASLMIPDSMLVVDTAKQSSLEKSTGVGILMRSDHFRLMLANRQTMKVLYSAIFNTSEFHFTIDENYSYLRKHIVPVFFFFLVKEFSSTFFSVLFSMIFLTFSANILVLPRRMKLGEYFKMSCYALTPYCVGTMLIAVAGARLSWSWYLCIFISAFILLRGIKSMARVSEEE